MLRFGTSYEDAINQAGGFKGDPKKVISGGPMMGFAVNRLDIPVTKGTSGLTVFSAAEDVETKESNCIRCGRCVSVCPIGLQPFKLDAASRKKDVEVLKQCDVMSCINCGCCTYVCPAKRNLAQNIALGKGVYTQATKKK